MSEPKPTIEEQDHVELADDESTHLKGTSGSPIPPVVVIGFVIIALLGGLAAIALRGGFTHAKSDPAEVARLNAETKALQNQLNRERLSLGLRPLENESETIEELGNRLKKDADTMVALARGLEKLLAEAESNSRGKDTQLLQAEKTRQSLTLDSVTMQEELRRLRVAGADADLLRGQLANSKSQSDAMMSELDQLRKELATKGEGASKDDLADIQRRLDEALRAKDFFESKANDLQRELDRTKSKLFAASENELLPAAVELFRSLRKLEGLPDAEFSAAYNKLGADIGATVLRKLDFATGSDTLSPQDEDAIRALVETIPDGDLVLCVGYASETGNVDANRTLSSSRATVAAELYSRTKRAEQSVQAVYLGQTDRFSSRIPERNQIVEIWQLHKK